MRLVTPIGNSSEIRAVKFCPNNKLMLTVSDDNYNIVYDVRSGKEVIKLEGHKEKILFSNSKENECLNQNAVKE